MGYHPHVACWRHLCRGLPASPISIHLGRGQLWIPWGWMYPRTPRPVLALVLVDQLYGYVHRGSLQPISTAVPNQMLLQSLCLWVSGWGVCGRTFFPLRTGFLGVFCFTNLQLAFSETPTFDFWSSFVMNQRGISVFSQTLFKPSWTHPRLGGDVFVFPICSYWCWITHLTWDSALQSISYLFRPLFTLLSSSSQRDWTHHHLAVYLYYFLHCIFMLERSKLLGMHGIMQ